MQCHFSSWQGGIKIQNTLFILDNLYGAALEDKWNDCESKLENFSKLVTFKLKHRTVWQCRDSHQLIRLYYLLSVSEEKNSDVEISFRSLSQTKWMGLKSRLKLMPWWRDRRKTYFLASVPRLPELQETGTRCSPAWSDTGTPSQMSQISSVGAFEWSLPTLQLSHHNNDAMQHN